MAARVKLNIVLFFKANFPQEIVDRLPEDIGGGVYYGFASVDDGPVFKMVMSIGWNPYYKNTKKSMVSLTRYFTPYQYFIFFLQDFPKPPPERLLTVESCKVLNLLSPN